MASFSRAFDPDSASPLVLPWLIKMNDFLMVGDFRGVADCYRSGFEATDVDRWDPWANFMLSGWMSVILNGEGGVKACAADFQRLDAFLDEWETAPPHLVACAAFSRGVFRWDKFDREAAARDYRRCIAVTERATSSDRAAAVVVTARNGFSVEKASTVIDHQQRLSRGNLGILDGTAPNVPPPPADCAPAESQESVGIGGVPLVKGAYTAQNFQVTMGHESLFGPGDNPELDLKVVSSDACLQCGVRRADLKKCSR